MGHFKMDHIKQLITLTSDNIKRLLLYLLSRSSHVYAWGGCMWPLCDGKVNSDSTAVDFLQESNHLLKFKLG